MSDQMRKLMNLMEDTSGNDAAVKSGVLQMLARDNINTLADWNALSSREKYRYGDQASDLFYNHGWIDDEAMPDSAMFADMIDSVLNDTNKSGNNDDSFSVAILSALRREGVTSIDDWKAMPRNRRREIVSLTTDIFYNEGNWDGMEDYHAFEEIITDILLDEKG